jgi:hypothetical protein
MVYPARLHLLAERHHIRFFPLGQIPVLVRPEFARRPDAGLYLVDDEEGAVLLGKGAEGAEV